MGARVLKNAVTVPDIRRENHGSCGYENTDAKITPSFNCSYILNNTTLMFMIYILQYKKEIYFYDPNNFPYKANLFVP